MSQNSNEQYEEDMAKLIGQYQQSIKKKKIGVAKEIQKKILDMYDHQSNQKVKCYKNVFKDLSEITTRAEAEYNAIKENEQKLKHLTNSYMKCIQQSITAYKHNLEALKELHASYEKEYEEIENKQKSEVEKLIYTLDVDIKKLQDQLISECKRNSMESLSRIIFQVMKNDF